MLRFGTMLLLLLGTGLWGPAAEADDTAALAARIIVLANADDPESMALARHYLAVRGIPEANLVALSLPPAETITWSVFTAQLFNPLQAWLVDHGWIEGIGMDLLDDYGRRKYALSAHHISFLVVCRGVPLRVSHAGSWVQNPDGQRLPPQFRFNGAAVDSELALLAQSGTPVNAVVPNPLFNRPHPNALARNQVVRVSRLDGPSAAAARALIDDAVRVERNGLLGRAVIDPTGPHRHGRTWLETTATHLREAHYDVQVNAGPGNLPQTARADDMAWYLGWYAGRPEGPFTLPGFRFAPGAIALHIHSNSATSLRSTDGGGWTGPLIARGAAASFGNVYEPYLEMTHRPDILVAALLRGARLGEATFEALPVLSWQAVAIGDPLYRPLRRSLAEQWAGRQDLPPHLSPTVAVREMLRLEAADEGEAALALGRRAGRETPGLGLNLALADRLLAKAEIPGALTLLGTARWVKNPRSTDWGLLAITARRLDELGDRPGAMAVWDNLLAADPPVDLRRRWLEAARDVALNSQDLTAAARYSQELLALVPLDAAPQP